MLLRPGLLAVEYKPIASQSPTLQKFAIDTESLKTIVILFYSSPRGTA
jgi:hypothetical protein